MHRPSEIIQLDEGHLVIDGARLAGHAAAAWIEIDRDEHARRKRDGIGAITELSALRDLVGYGDVTTRFKLAARVEHVEVSAGRPVTRLQVASVFANVAPTLVIVENEECDDMLALNAAALGIGLAVRLGQSLSILVPPSPEYGMVDAATLRFNEEAYRVWLATS